MSITLKKPHFRARLFGVLAVCTVAGIVAPAHAAHDTDLDGVTNEDEASLGTDPNKKDTDGDGIPDNVELSTTGGTAPFQLVNSDTDFTIDALDLDSDNDCVLDSVEGVGSFRNPNIPNSPASLNCPAATPICLATNGSCVKCSANFGGGGAACPTAAKPACHLGDTIDGQCTACKDGQTTLCQGTTPACEKTTGTCAACNGHFNDPSPAATAKCTNPALPACNQAGSPLAGRCTVCSPTNVSQCPTDTPLCDGTSGQCAKCNGDRNSGATFACPNADTPYCFLGGANFGKCGKCTSNADCGAGHTGPTCDIPNGRCFDTDSDGDGLDDSIELSLGTDPSKKDTDGDGVSDLVEVTPNGGGQFAKVDTDKDGVIDAKDTDSDNDGIPDGEESPAGVGDAGAFDAGGPDGGAFLGLDTDNDGIPDWRDEDDDNDGVLTKDEIFDTKLAKVADDVDNDGKKNWHDTDSNGNGTDDKTEGRGDDDSDGIPNYLDITKPTPPPDAKPPIGGEAVITDPPDAAPPPPPPPFDEGVLEGSSLCSTTNGVASPFVLVVMSGILAIAIRRRATRRRKR